MCNNDNSYTNSYKIKKIMQQNQNKQTSTTPNSERPLPTLAELHQDVQAAFKNDQFKLLLNQPPHTSWLKKHPLETTKNDQGQKVPTEYLPIDKIEFMLDRIFQEWKIEVLQATVMFQSIAVTVRLHYKSPVTGEWCFHDGVGAKSVQTNQGASAADLSAIKDAAVQMALPSAKSFAIKDAAEHLGALFGRDLNRRDVVMFAGAYGPEQPAQTPPQPQHFEQQPQQQPSWQSQPNPYEQHQTASQPTASQTWQNQANVKPNSQPVNFSAL
jgi:hypothetical protein